MVPVEVLRLFQNGYVRLRVGNALGDVSNREQASLLLCVDRGVELDLEVWLKRHSLFDPVHDVGLLLLRALEHNVVRINIALVAGTEPGNHKSDLLV